MTGGERERVPFLPHDNFVGGSEAVGRILVKGYVSISYFISYFFVKGMFIHTYMHTYIHLYLTTQVMKIGKTKVLMWTWLTTVN